MADTTTCAHGVDLSTPCADCQRVCDEIDRTGTVTR